jgi:hypothetical protein
MASRAQIRATRKANSLANTMGRRAVEDGDWAVVVPGGKVRKLDNMERQDIQVAIKAASGTHKKARGKRVDLASLLQNDGPVKSLRGAKTAFIDFNGSGRKRGRDEFEADQPKVQLRKQVAGKNGKPPATKIQRVENNAFASLLDIPAADDKGDVWNGALPTATKTKPALSGWAAIAAKVPAPTPVPAPAPARIQRSPSPEPNWNSVRFNETISLIPNEEFDWGDDSDEDGDWA